MIIQLPNSDCPNDNTPFTNNLCGPGIDNMGLTNHIMAQILALVAMFRPQRVGLNTIIDLYILTSTGSALQNVKELHVLLF